MEKYLEALEIFLKETGMTKAKLQEEFHMEEYGVKPGPEDSDRLRKRMDNWFKGTHPPCDVNADILKKIFNAHGVTEAERLMDELINEAKKQGQISNDYQKERKRENIANQRALKKGNYAEIIQWSEDVDKNGYYYNEETKEKTRKKEIASKIMKDTLKRHFPLLSEEDQIELENMYPSQAVIDNIISNDKLSEEAKEYLNEVKKYGLTREKWISMYKSSYETPYGHIKFTTILNAPSLIYITLANMLFNDKFGNKIHSCNIRELASYGNRVYGLKRYCEDGRALQIASFAKNSGKWRVKSLQHGSIYNEPDL